jgi:hypothetical protein
VNEAAQLILSASAGAVTAVLVERFTGLPSHLLRALHCRRQCDVWTSQPSVAEPYERRGQWLDRRPLTAGELSDIEIYGNTESVQTGNTITRADLPPKRCPTWREAWRRTA